MSRTRRNFTTQFKAKLVLKVLKMENIKEARQAIAAYIHKYNFERCHSAIGNVPPASVYYPAMLYEAAKEAA